MSDGSTIARIANVDEASAAQVARSRRALHLIVTSLLSLVMLTAVLDGLDMLDLFGPDEDRAHASGGGYALVVEHPSITRPALATVFRIAVTHAGGFGEEPVQIAVSRSYLESFDVNGVIPATSGETAEGRWIIWEFDPPPGDEFVVTYEARLEPGVQWSRRGEVAVMVDDEPVARTHFETKVRP